MRETITRHGARAALYTLAACAILCAHAASASAQSNRLGPGPFTGGRVTENGIVLTIDASARSAVPLSGAVRVSATRGSAEWTPFDDRAAAKQAGAQLVQRGGVGGVPVDEYFPEDEQRRLLVRNGDGRETEVDVERIGDAFYIRTSNRSPGMPTSVSSTPTATAEIDALSDSSVTLELGRQESRSGLEIVVALSPAALPEGIDAQFPRVVAVAEDGTPYPGSDYGYGDTATFHHIVLPEGEYTLRLSNSVSLGSPPGSPLAYSLLVAFGDVLTTHVTVSPEAHLFAMTVPPVPAQQLVDATVVVDGLEQFDPSFGSRLDLTLLLVSSDGLTQLSAKRDIGNADPVSLSVRLPAGEYSATILAAHDDGQLNGRGYSIQLSLGTHTIPDDATLSIPPLARLTGSFVDPGLSMASEFASGIFGNPTHSIYLSRAGGTGVPFNAQATVRGFGRSYEAYVPRGAAVTAGGSVTVAVGRPPKRYRSSENATGTLSLVPEGASVACDGDCELDLAVPTLPSHVVVSGKVIDGRGRPVVRALVFVSLSGVDGGNGRFETAVATSNTGEFGLRLPRGRGYRLLAYPLL